MTICNELTMQPNILEVYWTLLPEAMPRKELEENVTILDPEERQRYDRYPVASKKVQFMTGRLMLKTLLARRLGIAPHEVRLSQNPYGKPSLHEQHGQAKVYFNLSHTDGLVVCVLSPWDGVGIDVEREDRDARKAMPLAFLPDEIAFIQGWSTEVEQLAAFHLLWTRKEAVIKAVGMGFSLQPHTFTVPFQRGQAADASYLYFDIPLEPGYMCSLALTKDQTPEAPALHLQRMEMQALRYGVTVNTVAPGFIRTGTAGRPLSHEIPCDGVLPPCPAT